MAGKTIKIYLVEEGNKPVEIGFGTCEQFENGSLGLDLILAGDYTLRSNNIAGMAHLDGYIDWSLRKG